ncbi:MAG: OmpA family protein [Holosporales bacterium]
MEKKSVLLSSAGIIAAAGLLSGCAEYNIRELEAANKEGYEFSRQLAAQYDAFAKKESREMNDEIDASHFAVKGIQAAAGEEVLPEDPRRWEIPNNKLQQYLDWRERLIFTLTKGGKRIAPALAAKTQVMYDCAIEESEENFDAQDIMKCEKGFMDNLIEMEKMVNTKAPTFTVRFDYNSSKLSPEAMKVIAEVAKVSQNMDRHTVTISGHTDMIGGRKNNLVLSQNRAAIVAEALVKAGVPKERITAVGLGEKEGKEVDPHNRRVDIHLH